MRDGVTEDEKVLVSAQNTQTPRPSSATSAILLILFQFGGKPSYNQRFTVERNRSRA